MKNNNLPWWAKNGSKAPSRWSSLRRIKLSSVASFIAFSSLIGTGASYGIFAPDPSQPEATIFNSVNYPADVNEILADCGGVFDFAIDRDHYGLIPEGYEAEVPVAPMLVPVYGYMDSNGLPDDTFFYSLEDAPEREAVLRSLYDGKVVLWYSVDILDDIDIDNVKSLALNSNSFIAIGYKGDLPLGRSYAMSTWGSSESCDILSPEVIQNFISNKSVKTPGYSGALPPDAVLNKNNRLQEIILPGE